MIRKSMGVLGTFVFLSTVGLAGCSAGIQQTKCLSGNPADTLVISYDNDRRATQQLVDFLNEHGINASIPSNFKGKDTLMVKRNGTTFLLEPKMQADSGRADRILVHLIFGVKENKVGTQELKDWVEKLNNDYNIGTFSAVRDMLLISAQITFLNRIGIDEIKAFLNDFDRSSSEAVLQSNGKEFLQ